MASYQRVALFILFDAIEADLVLRLRQLAETKEIDLLTPEERKKAGDRLRRRDNDSLAADDFDLLNGLDLGDKYSVLMRHRADLDLSAQKYYEEKNRSFERAIPIRNTTMHGRPLTTEEYALGFSLANEFLKTPRYWPTLSATYNQYAKDPKSFIDASISLLDDEQSGEALNNLPIPDYDDTGFLPRPTLEKELKKKILGRHPVITVLGDGGNGKTALALQTLYGLLESNDHPFDAIVWVSAKSATLTHGEILRIEGAINSSLRIFEEVANLLEPGDAAPFDRVLRLMEDNKILLAIDNLETVLDAALQNFASDVPGQSKLLLTSRVPLGSDLIINVGAFSPAEAKSYLYRLIDAYDIVALRRESKTKLEAYLARLSFKPLLIKWFALGVVSGIDPDKITKNPAVALRFCMENVFERLETRSKSVLFAMSVLPSGSSTAVLEHITDFTALEVEAAIAELLKYSLIERSTTSDFETQYQIKPFTKAYLVKVLRASPEDAVAILERYRSIESAYQSERGGQFSNRYDRRSIVVRSRTEAIVARKLRYAVILAFKQRYAEANEIISLLKVTSSDYFEVHRIEAYVAYRQGDVGRANSCYQVAIELAVDQPQLHMFYAGFLVRAFADYVGAGEHIDRAIEIDSKSDILVREAARIKLFQYDFDGAQSFINKVRELGVKGTKDRILTADLQAQLFSRKADHYRLVDPGKAAATLCELLDYLGTLEPEVFDETLVDHLGRANITIEGLLRSPYVTNLEPLNELKTLINGLSPVPNIPSEMMDAERSAKFALKRVGTLKAAGRTETFGFLRDSGNRDTFLSRSSISEVMWQDLCAGKTVQYDIFTDYKTNRTKAVNVSLL